MKGKSKGALATPLTTVPPFNGREQDPQMKLSSPKAAPNTKSMSSDAAGKSCFRDAVAYIK